LVLSTTAGPKYPQYARDPVGYVRNVLRRQLTPQQEEAANAVPQYRWVLVPSANETGKTFLAACLASWHYDCYFPSITLTTAPAAHQVEDLLFRELRGLRRGDPNFLPKSPRLQDAEDHFIHGLTAKDENAFQGRHEAHIFGLYDEGTGIQDAFFEAGWSMFDWMLVIYNPTDSGSYVYRAEQSGRWHVVRMSALDHPNVIVALRGLGFDRPVGETCPNDAPTSNPAGTTSQGGTGGQPPTGTPTPLLKEAAPVGLQSGSGDRVPRLSPMVSGSTADHVGATVLDPRGPLTLRSDPLPSTETATPQGDKVNVWASVLPQSGVHQRSEQGKPTVPLVLPFPKAVTLAKVLDRLAEWADPLQPGEPVDPERDVYVAGQWWRLGPAAEARLLGRWPTLGTDTVFGPGLWESIKKTRIALQDQWPLVMGCDVARYGDDDTSIHARRGPCSVWHESHNGWGTHTTANRLKELAHQLCPPGGNPPTRPGPH
jgi:hypothetical protein